MAEYEGVIINKDNLIGVIDNNNILDGVISNRAQLVGLVQSIEYKGSIVAHGNLIGLVSANNPLVGVISNQSQLIGKIQIAEHVSYEPYQGDYEVCPACNCDQIIKTKNKLMLNDMVVDKIPYAEVQNESGLTVSIAS